MRGKYPERGNSVVGLKPFWSPSTHFIQHTTCGTHCHKLFRATLSVLLYVSDAQISGLRDLLFVLPTVQGQNSGPEGSASCK